MHSTTVVWILCIVIEYAYYTTCRVVVLEYAYKIFSLEDEACKNIE